MFNFVKVFLIRIIEKWQGGDIIRIGKCETPGKNEHLPNCCTLDDVMSQGELTTHKSWTGPIFRSPLFSRSLLKLTSLLFYKPIEPNWNEFLKFQIRYEGNASASSGTTMPATFWKSDGKFIATVTPFDSTKSFSAKTYRYMFERLREKAGYLDETICRLSDQLVK